MTDTSRKAQLTAELLLLTQQQQKALEDATFLGWLPGQLDAYEKRGERVALLRQDSLAPVQERLDASPGTLPVATSTRNRPSQPEPRLNILLNITGRGAQSVDTFKAPARVNYSTNRIHRRSFLIPKVLTLWSDACQALRRQSFDWFRLGPPSRVQCCDVPRPSGVAVDRAVDLFNGSGGTMLFFRFAAATRESPLSVENIVKEVRAEIARLQQVLALLGAGFGHNAAAKRNVAPTNAAPRRKLSAAGRRRIAAAQKARWAKIRAATKK